MKVVPAFIQIVPKLIANNYLVGIVTFSDAFVRARRDHHHHHHHHHHPPVVTNELMCADVFCR